MAFAETANLAVKLTLGGNFTSQLAKARAGLRGLERESRGFKAGGQIATGIKRSFLLVGAGASLAAVGIGKAIDAAGDFEAQLNTINTIARATPQTLGKIGDSVRQIARDTGTPLEDLTQGYYDLLSAGIKTADAQDVLLQANKLAIGGLSTTAEAVDLLTSAINVYGGDATQAASFTDIFAKAVERGKVTTAGIAGTFSTVGPLASAYAIGIDEIGAAYARLTAGGNSPGEAATQMRSAIQSLAKPDKALRALQATTKKNYLSIAGKQGLVVALQQMRDDAKKAGIPLSLLTSRIEAMQFLLQTTGPNFAAYQADLKAMGDAGGTAAAQMAERQKGLNFQLAKLKSLAKDAGITIGTALLPKLTPVVEELNKLITGHQGDISAFGEQLAAAFTPENVINGIHAITDAVGPMIDLLKIAAAPVKAIVDAFLKLPKEVQTVLVGAFAVNKLTGGLVTNAAGGIIEAIGKGLLGGIKAPLVNVTGGVVNVGGGLPGGGVPGGLPGAAGGIGLGTVLGAASIVAVPLASIAVQLANLKPVSEQTKPFFLAGKGGSIRVDAPAVVAAIKSTAFHDSRERRGRPSPPPFHDSRERRGPLSLESMRRGTERFVVKSPSVTTNVDVNVKVTAAGIQKTVTVHKRYGPPAGSRESWIGHDTYDR